MKFSSNKSSSLTAVSEFISSRAESVFNDRALKTVFRRYSGAVAKRGLADLAFVSNVTGRQEGSFHKYFRCALIKIL